MGCGGRGVGSRERVAGEQGVRGVVAWTPEGDGDAEALLPCVASP